MFLDGSGSPSASLSSEAAGGIVSETRPVGVFDFLPFRLACVSHVASCGTGTANVRHDRAGGRLQRPEMIPFSSAISPVTSPAQCFRAK
jgi:hypothetical protein